jgi:hypothetical protein
MLVLRAIILSAGVLISGAAFAAEKCYETVPVAATTACGDSTGDPADFTAPCTHEGGGSEEIEVDCPGQWVNIGQATSEAQRPFRAMRRSAAPRD